MPYAPLSKLKEEQQGQPGAGVNISGGAGASFTDGLPGQDKAQASSGQYANLQSYLDANQSQGGEMGQKVASGVESQGADATSKVNAFDSQKQSVAAYDPNSAISRAGSLSADEKSQYQTQKQTGGYTGPQTVDRAEGYQDTQQAAMKAATAAKQAGTELGQQQLLKQTYERPDYSKGQQNLDQVLMKGNVAAKDQLQAASSKYSDLENMFNTKSGEVGQSINAANAQALANRQAFNPAETGAWKGLIDPIQARADELNKQNPAAYQGVMSDVSDDELTADTMQRLGLGAGQQLWDTNLSSYLSPNQTQLGINDAANADERSKYSALGDLFQDPTRSQIGAAGGDTKALNFDKTRFDKDVASKGAEYEKAYETDRSYFGGPNQSQVTPKELEEIHLPKAIADGNTMLINDINYVLNNFKNQWKTGRTVQAGV